MIDASEWNWSNHALRRAVDMALDAGVLTGILTSPTETWLAPEIGCWYLSDKRVTLVVDVEAKSVITVVWYLRHGMARYKRDDFEQEMKRVRDVRPE